MPNERETAIMDMPLPNTAPVPPADANATAIDASFDIVARQDRVEQQVEGLRSEVEEVKLRVDRIAQGAQRAAQRPALAATSAAQTEVKGFVDGYLRRGNTHEIKSISGTSPSDGGYAVPRQIDAMIARCGGGRA